MFEEFQANLCYKESPDKSKIILFYERIKDAKTMQFNGNAKFNKMGAIETVKSEIDTIYKMGGKLVFYDPIVPDNCKFFGYKLN